MGGLCDPGRSQVRTLQAALRWSEYTSWGLVNLCLSVLLWNNEWNYSTVHSEWVSNQHIWSLNTIYPCICRYVCLKYDSKKTPKNLSTMCYCAAVLLCYWVVTFILHYIYQWHWLCALKLPSAVNVGQHPHDTQCYFLLWGCKGHRMIMMQLLLQTAGCSAMKGCTHP